MFKESEGEPLRLGNNFRIGSQRPLACKNHEVLGQEKIINQPSRWFFIQFGKETLW